MYDITRYSFNMSNLVSGLFCICLVPCWPCILIAARRTIRTNHNLEGNIISDVICGLALCTFPCLACQIRDEIIFLKRIQLWQLGSDNDVNFLSPKFKCLNSLPFGLQSGNELMTFAKDNNMLEDLTPEDGMAKIGLIQKEYEEHIMNKVSKTSSGSDKEKNENESNMYRSMLIRQQSISRV